jgi:hypothetical protein
VGILLFPRDICQCVTFVRECWFVDVDALATRITWSMPLGPAVGQPSPAFFLSTIMFHACLTFLFVCAFRSLTRSL